MKYMLSLIGEEEDGEGGDATPEQMQALMDPWAEFDRQLVEAGAFVAGEALQPSSTATTVKASESGDRTVTDGPFAETKEQLGGFYLIECADLDAALEWAQKVPMGSGGSVEVRPAMDFTQFGYPDAYKLAAGAS
jgi:hypothetical protein